MSEDRLPARPTHSAPGEPSSSIDLDRTVRARIDDGSRCLQAIGGPDYNGPLKKVAEVSPDMAALLLAFPYGDVMSRPGLSLRERQICTIAMLLAIPWHARPRHPLRVGSAHPATVPYRCGDSRDLFPGDGVGAITSWHRLG